MKLRHILIKVDDQDKALAFYTSVIGLVKKRDDDGGPVRWLTVTAADDRDGTELVLEPSNAAPSRAAQQALYDAHFPAALITVNDIHADFDRLTGLGVKFLRPPRRTVR